MIERYLPGCGISERRQRAPHVLRYVWSDTDNDILYRDGTRLYDRFERKLLLDKLGSEARITVAEHAVGRVFVHAGVVGWQGKAIVMPARSFMGKSALTAALVKLGATYYSDEYAVFDEKGFVHPFPKDLSLRGIVDDYCQVDRTAESLGGRIGKKPIPVGSVVITEFKKGAAWNPRYLNAGRGVMALIKNAVPIRRDPMFTLPVLTKAAGRALVIETKRGEAATAAGLLIESISGDLRARKI